MKNKKRGKEKPVLVIVLIILLAILFVVSRTLRMKPTNMQSVPTNEQIAPPAEQNNLEPAESSHTMDIQQRPDINILLGKHTRKQTDSLFTQIPVTLANREGMMMHQEAFAAFLAMHEAAKQDGVELIVISAYRNFNHQKRIWENKWNGRQILSSGISAATINDPLDRATEILRYSAMPGTSRHHWGTDIDINSLNNNYFRQGRGKEEYEWLKENASRFGFCQPYTVRENRAMKGYEEEKWHWSYLPVASLYLKTYRDSVNYDHIRGFDGWETAQQLEVISNYVLAVDAECKK